MCSAADLMKKDSWMNRATTNGEYRGFAMNIKDKVQELLMYCSSYQGHSYMVDERRTDEEFRVELPEEKEILKDLGHLQFILLTGEAGDGKSHLLRSLHKQLVEYGFQIYQDFSALPEESRAAGADGQPMAGKKEIVHTIAEILDGNSDKRIIIAANVGIFTKSVLMYDEALLDTLNHRDERVRIINFEKRNLADDREVFSRIVEAFYEYDGKECPDKSCGHCTRCAYKENIDFLCSPPGVESIRVLCDTVFLMGSHITFRELLSLLAHLVTMGEGCEERREWDPCESDGFEHIFSLKNDKILQKISRMDPAFKKSGTFDLEERCKDLAEYKKEKRLRFFEAEDNKYQFLAVDYLSQFQEALHCFDREPYVASEMIKDGILYQVKRGIGRLTRRGQSDLSMKVADTPSMLGDDIQTEFELGIIDMIWHRYGLDFNQLEEDDGDMRNQNCFGMSYVYPAEDGKILEKITLMIDYKLFRYLMMADEYFYLSHNSKSIEEYTINTFFRKILKKKEGAYEKMLVKFVNQEETRYCNFSLGIQEMNRILYKGKKVIKLKREG